MKERKKYFGTDGIRGKVGEALINPEFVLKLGWAAGKVLEHKSGSKVLIGKDTRVSGYMFESALEAGLAAAGVHTHLLGPMPTPGIAYLTRALRAQAGIVISASHNPYPDNGIKFFSYQGMKLSDEVEYEIEAMLDKPMTIAEPAKIGRAFRIADATGRYIEFCKSTIPSEVSLKGMKIIVDCAYGATYYVGPCVFRELGAEVVEVATEPDGLNINENCGSTQPHLLQRLVKLEKADLGIAFDGDGDRVIMVDHKGDLVDGDELLYVMAMEAQRRKKLKGGVVGTVMTNFGLEQALGRAKIPFKRVAVGDRHVMQALLESDWLIGGESSGHIVNLAHTTTGDGIISALQILRIMFYTQKSLHELKAELKKFPQTLINVKLDSTDGLLEDKAVVKMQKDIEQELGHTGRLLVRLSGTEPVIRVMIEGQKEEQVSALAEQMAACIKSVAKNRQPVT